MVCMLIKYLLICKNIIWAYLFATRKRIILYTLIIDHLLHIYFSTNNKYKYFLKSANNIYISQLVLSYEEIAPLPLRQYWEKKFFLPNLKFILFPWNYCQFIKAKLPFHNNIIFSYCCWSQFLYFVASLLLFSFNHHTYIHN